MRKIPALLITALTLVLMLAACGPAGPGATDKPALSPEGTGGAPIDMTDRAPEETGAAPTAEYPDSLTSDAAFSFTVGGVTLTLRQNNVDDELSAMPLTPVTDVTETLGEDSDTYAGCYMRTVDYGGLTLKMMAPKDEEDNFGILQMTATDAAAKTAKGAAVGDTLQTLLDKYPEAAALEWDSTAYLFKLPGADVGSLDEILFTVVDGSVTAITMTYNLP